MNLRLRENPWRLMLAVNVAVVIGVFLYKITLPPYVPYIHLVVDYHFGFTKRALIGAVLGLFFPEVPVWLVFALGGAIWLITLWLFIKLFRRTFGLDFLLDGSIQRVRNRLRITVRLLDLRAGNQVVWARRFDRQSNDLLSLQDEIASEVVAQIDPEILLIEAKRSSARPPIDATAYDLMLRAIPLIGRMEHGPFMQAGQHLSDAIALERSLDRADEERALISRLTTTYGYRIVQPGTDDLTLLVKPGALEHQQLAQVRSEDR